MLQKNGHKLREFAVPIVSLIMFINPLLYSNQPALAGIDLKQIEQIQKLQEAQTALDSADVEFIKLPSGASYREFRVGRGEQTVQKGDTVLVEMTIRAKTLFTAKDPGGVKYYDSKVDAPLKALTWVVGSGEAIPELEEAMIGMKRSAIRRIEIPSQQIFKARKNNQLPQPAKTDDEGQRRYKNLFKTDATSIFEVLVTRIVANN